MAAHPRIEYVEARPVLLDAFDALRGQLDAVVLVGASIRAGGVSPGSTGCRQTCQPTQRDKLKSESSSISCLSAGHAAQRTSELGPTRRRPARGPGRDTSEGEEVLV